MLNNAPHYYFDSIVPHANVFNASLFEGEVVIYPECGECIRLAVSFICTCRFITFALFKQGLS
jgi:hypothetical protein